ncbi:MAG: hypothetical protein HYT77_03840 [Deltaproteobacteria bacterium]|nr:hypothetical protein [Deltaproteobacteria bacterium]
MRSIVVGTLFVAAFLLSSCMMFHHGMMGSHQTKKDNNHQILVGRIIEVEADSFVLEVREGHRYEFEIAHDAKLSKKRLSRYRDNRRTRVPGTLTTS